MAAGLVHAVTIFCSHGNITECVCEGRLGGRGLAQESWHWGGCSQHIRYGTWFSRKFMDGGVGNISASEGGVTLAVMNQHNSEVGRQVRPPPHLPAGIHLSWVFSGSLSPSSRPFTG